MSDEQLTPEEKMLEDIFGKSKKPRERKPATEKIEEVLKALTPRESEIIKLRYGLGDGHTYTVEECGQIFKVQKERIRQIEQKAVRKLQRLGHKEKKSE